MNKFKTFCLVTIIVILSACASSPYGQKQTVGGLAGAALGGLLGAQFGGGKGQLASTAVGVLLGGLMGSEIGRFTTKPTQVNTMSMQDDHKSSERCPGR